jgi:hypothetical protein
MKCILLKITLKKLNQKIFLLKEYPPTAFSIINKEILNEDVKTKIPSSFQKI